MNLVNGKPVDGAEARKVLETLRERIAATLEKPLLPVEAVLDACGALAQSAGEEHAALLRAAGLGEAKSREYVREAKEMLRRETLLRRLRIELGEDFASGKRIVLQDGRTVTERLYPLGVLFHIAAGNQYGLAFYSVVEGLLTGNINIVKLPSGDDGLTAMIFMELFRIEPRLREYVYLFDFPSGDTQALAKMAEVSDAIAVWGGDRAVCAARRLAGADMKVVEWGHKLSFAYVTARGMEEEALKGVAQNMVSTNQLLCSSCQGIFVDTDSMEEIYAFCERFLPILCACREEGEALTDEIRAQMGIRVYTEELEAIYRPCRVFRGENASIAAYGDETLETAAGFGNCWVRPLPHGDMLRVLKPYKNHLQTAALLCAPEEKAALTERLFRCGIVRVADGKNMSGVYPGAAHDGEYPLRRYMRIVSDETAYE